MPVVVDPRVEEAVKTTNEFIMGAENVFAWPVRPGWKSSQADRPSEESEPVCSLNTARNIKDECGSSMKNCEVQDKMCTAANILSQEVRDCQ